MSAVTADPIPTAAPAAAPSRATLPCPAAARLPAADRTGSSASSDTAADAARAAVARTVARHSLAWLLAANFVGLWLAASLLWPALGDTLAPLTYGRWMPLHLNWQLYGWCALPLVGALLAWCFDFRHPRIRRHARLVLACWSAALALGGLSWLGGVSSGKLFLDWHGWARPLLPLAMVALWSFLGAHTVWRWPDLDRTGRLLRVAVLAGLVVVPPLLHWAAGREVYPPVNPDSGGATGAALLGSTLALVSLYGLLPRMLGVVSARPARWFWPALGVSWVAYSLIGHGHTSHHDLRQIVALGLLFLWIPGLALWWRAGDWHPAARPWQTAALVWWALLVADGWLAFLPGLSERWKFTHALVAHSHLAMAGLVTSAGLMILTQFARRPVARASFWAWQLGCAVHVAALLVLGWDEIADAHALFRSETWTQLLLGLRLAAGATMTVAAARWWLDFRAP